MVNENHLESLKKKLFRLHFLLTDRENAESVRESEEYFKLCFTEAMSELASFLSTEYNEAPKNNDEILECAFKHKLFNQEMIESLKKMVKDFNDLQVGKNRDQIYFNIRDRYAAFLQVIHDMLAKMGQDVEDDEE